MFKVGDAVRVKAGSPSGVLWSGARNSIPRGRRHIVEFVGVGAASLSGGDYVAENRFLEPWNDAEEWDGAKWVAKKAETPPKPAVVMSAGGIYISKHDSTNAAVKAAKERSEAFPGSEYVVYQEKASFKVEPKSKAEIIRDAFNRAGHGEITDVKEDANPLPK